MIVATLSYGKVFGKAKNYPYYQTAIYNIGKNKKTGKTIYKYIQHVGTARRSFNLAMKDLDEYVQSNDCIKVISARHNQPVKFPLSDKKLLPSDVVVLE